MREIKFRGKCIDNGEWVYGAYMKHIKRTPNITGDSLKESDYQNIILFSGFSDWNMPKPINCHEIKIETVGQYTGLKDKNGKEIYEGDIYHMGDKNILYTVVWGDCGLRGKQQGSSSFAGLIHWLDRIEVVGNICESEDNNEHK